MFKCGWYEAGMMAGTVHRKVPASTIHVPIGMFQDATIRLGVQNGTTLLRVLVYPTALD